MTAKNAEIKALKTENAKLREALQAIAEDGWIEGTKAGNGPFKGMTEEEIAKAALTAGQG
jgi:DNA-binding FadR family transcriptional regulator